MWSLKEKNAIQLRSGRPAPSYERSTEITVVLVLPGGKASMEFVRLVVEENRANRLLILDEILLLNALWQERSLPTNRAAQLIQKPEPEARSVLQRLVEAGLVEARGERKARAYHLSSGTNRRLGQKAEYVRQRGFEPLQQEQMVFQYVEKHGRITRRDAAELCRIAPHEASRFLNRMANQQRSRDVALEKAPGMDHIPKYEHVHKNTNMFIKYERIHKYRANLQTILKRAHAT